MKFPAAICGEFCCYVKQLIHLYLDCSVLHNESARVKFNGWIVEKGNQGDFVEIKVRPLESKTDDAITAHLDARLSQKGRLSVGQEIIAHWDREASSMLRG